MNLDELQRQIENVIKLLQAYKVEAEGVEQTAKTITDTNTVQITRERFLNERELAIKEHEKTLEEQKKYIEQQSENTRLLLGKVRGEREDIAKAIEAKDDIEKTRLENEAKTIELTQREKAVEALEAERDQFLQEKKLMVQQQLLETDRKQLLDMREQKIKEREDRLNRMEEMTQI